MIDAQIVGPTALPAGFTAQLFHQQLFDMELALTNLARFAASLAHWDLPTEQRHVIRETLAALQAGDVEAAHRAAWAILDHSENLANFSPGDDRAQRAAPPRFAVSAIDFVAAESAWLAVPPTTDTDGISEAFRPA